MALLVNLISKHDSDRNIFARFTSTKTLLNPGHQTNSKTLQRTANTLEKNETCGAQEWKFQPNMPARRLHWQNWHGTITQSGFNAYWSQAERAKSATTELQCFSNLNSQSHAQKKSTWHQMYCNDSHVSLQTWFACSCFWFWTKKIRLQRHGQILHWINTHFEKKTHVNFQICCILACVSNRVRSKIVN